MRLLLSVGAALVLGVSTWAAQSDVPIPTLPGPPCSKKIKEPCVTRARAISSPKPDYPAQAENLRLEGTVLVWLVVTEEGKPADVRIQKAAGHGFDQVAYECVKQWTFAPATYQGKPIPTIEEIEVNFRMDGRTDSVPICQGCRP